MGFHEEGVGRHTTAEQNRSAKEARVRAGRAHAALVYDGPSVVGWCQFGPTDELPRAPVSEAVSLNCGLWPAIMPSTGTPEPGCMW
jgi:hypothetical protein